jgi:hypothetical protein
MAVIIALGVSVLVVAFVAAPFFLFPGRRVPREDRLPDALQDLLAEKETVYASIQELDFDLKSGKISAKDHQALRERQEAHAAALLQRIDALQPSGETAPVPRKPRREKRKA